MILYMNFISPQLPFIYFQSVINFLQIPLVSRIFFEHQQFMLMVLLMPTSSIWFIHAMSFWQRLSEFWPDPTSYLSPTTNMRYGPTQRCASPAISGPEPPWVINRNNSWWLSQTSCIWFLYSLCILFGLSGPEHNLFWKIDNSFFLAKSNVKPPKINIATSLWIMEDALFKVLKKVLMKLTKRNSVKKVIQGDWQRLSIVISLLQS